MLIDGVLGGFKWYRKLCGGSWYKVGNVDSPFDFFWRREEPNEDEMLLNSEVYLEASTIDQISDGNHNFAELYGHRYLLFILLANTNYWTFKPWKSRLHKDGTSYPGYFVAGLKLPTGQISYHLPLRYWNMLEARSLLRAEWDGHTSQDVLRRILAALESSALIED